MHSAIQKTGVIRQQENSSEKGDDFLAVEEPLEIRLEYGNENDRKTRSLSITMRTPGNDAELTAGFLLTEGIVKQSSDILEIKHIQTLPGVESNYILAGLNPNLQFDLSKLERHFYTTSSCGVCGKSSIESLKSAVPADHSQKTGLTLNPELIFALPDKLRQAQSAFDSTGGIHASGLFDSHGNLIALREDVGRHNALDKLIGWALLNNQLPLHNCIVLLSGRGSFELIQKCAMAGIKTVCAVGAPSSLAVQSAAEFGITLIGFLRNRRYNVYNQAS
jgi:FdhD protein